MVKSLALIGSGPVVLVHTQNLRFFLKGKPHLVKGAQVAGHLAETSGHLVRKRRSEAGSLGHGALWRER
jgi:hypothetical protein